MPASHASLVTMTESERAEAVAAAVAALRSGGLVILPTDTVYGLAASAGHAGAMERLAELAPQPGGLPGEPLTWHAADAATVIDALGITAPVHLRMLSQNLPGAVRFLFEADAGFDAQAALGVPAGVMDREETDDQGRTHRLIGFRVPASLTAREVAMGMDGPVVAKRLAAAGWSPDRDPSAAIEPALAAGIEHILDDGPGVGLPTTLVRLRSTGGYRIEHEGAVDVRTIERRLTLRLLFVCTGNTCRSPMAESIAAHLVEHAEPGSIAGGLPIEVASAGVSAGDGHRASAEIGPALASMDITPRPHRSRALTPTMVDEATHIFVMGRHHADAVVGLSPGAADRIELIDPGGEDVPDPVGLPQHVYDATAGQLRAMIEQRLSELVP